MGTLAKFFKWAFFFQRNFFVASRYRETPHLQPTIADQGRPEPTRADQKTKMAHDRRCLIVGKVGVWIYAAAPSSEASRSRLCAAGERRNACV